MKRLLAPFKILASIFASICAVGLFIGVTIWGGILIAFLSTLATGAAIVAFVSVLIHELLFGEKDDS
tara:strand:- start:447 stop:647 length:201 start_codon:yes stop_codon:yes gene_type:complete